MKGIIAMGLSGDELGLEERNLISVGYKNMMSVRRTSWRTCQSMEEKEADPQLKTFYGQYKEMVRSEIDAVINKVMDEVVTKYTKGVLAAKKRENLVFFHKMEGDYYRYGAETSVDEQRTQYSEKARNAYESAQKAATDPEAAAEEPLEPTNPILLGLGLNQSVFYYEICNEKAEARTVAQSHFDAALDKLETLDEGDYKDATLIMQLLKDNLTLWDESEDEELAVEEFDQ